MGESSASLHSFSQEEVRSFAEHLNEVFGRDAFLTSPASGGAAGKPKIPINPVSSDELFEVLRDGVLFCRLVGVAKTDLIRPSIVVLQPRNKFEALGNISAVLFACNQLGLNLVNIGPEDIVGGEKKHLILSLLWQIIRYSLVSKVISSPALVQLLQPGEGIDILTRLPAEENLLRWVNYHLARSQQTSRRISNLSTDIMDCEVYDILLHQLAPSLCPRMLSDPSVVAALPPEARAARVLDNADKLGCRRFVTPLDIAQGHPKLNLAFVANLFNHHPAIAPPEEEHRARFEEMERSARLQMAQQEELFRQRLQLDRARFEEELEREKARMVQEFEGSWKEEESAKRRFLESAAAELEARRQALEQERLSFQRQREEQARQEKARSLSFEPPSPAVQMSVATHDPNYPNYPGSATEQMERQRSRSEIIEFGATSTYPAPPPVTPSSSFTGPPPPMSSSHSSIYASSAMATGSSYYPSPYSPYTAAAAATPAAPSGHPGSFYTPMGPAAGSFYTPTPAGGDGSFYHLTPPPPAPSSSFSAAPMGGGSVYSSSAAPMAAGSFYPPPMPTHHSSSYFPAPPTEGYYPPGQSSHMYSTTAVHHGSAAPVVQFPISRVRVTIEEAQNVAKKDLFGLGKSDPYCILAFKTERYTTRICYNTQHPVWYEDVIIQHVNPGDELVVALWDCDRLKKDDFLGEVRIFAKDFVFGSSQYYHLMPRRGRTEKITGDLRLKFQLV